MDRIVPRMAYIAQEVTRIPSQAEWNQATERLFKYFDFNTESNKGLGVVSYDRM